MTGKLDLKKTDIQTLLSTRKYIFIAGAMLFIGAGILIFGVFLQGNSLYELVNANTAEQKTQNSLQSKVKALQQVNYLSEFSKSPQVDLALPSQKPLLQLISGMNIVAQQSGVALSDLITTPGKLASQSASTITQGNAAGVVDTNSDVPGVKYLTIGVKAQGTLPQINTFLDSIEKITPITQATQFKLNVIPQTPQTASLSGGLSQYQADLQLSTYYFSQAIEVTVDNPLPTIGAKEETFLNSLDSYQFPDYQKQQVIQGGGSSDLFGAQ